MANDNLGVECNCNNGQSYKTWKGLAKCCFSPWFSNCINVGIYVRLVNVWQCFSSRIWHVAQDFLKSDYQVVPCLNQCVVQINKNCLTMIAKVMVSFQWCWKGREVASMGITCIHITFLNGSMFIIDKNAYKMDLWYGYHQERKESQYGKWVVHVVRNLGEWEGTHQISKLH
jgi:hypothetical protein